MTIREDIAVLHAIKADHKSQTALTAINDAISALMTIEDMSFYGIPPVKKEPETAGFDMKTLYEQTTMYCTLIKQFRTASNYNIEVYQQYNTPIYVIIKWYNTKLISIDYTTEIGEPYI